MPSDAELAAAKAEKEAEEAVLKASKARQAAEDARKDQEIADLKAQLDRLSMGKVQEIPPVDGNKTELKVKAEPVGKDGMTTSQRREAKIKSKARLVKPPKKEKKVPVEVAPVA